MRTCDEIVYRSGYPLALPGISYCLVARIAWYLVLPGISYCLEKHTLTTDVTRTHLRVLTLHPMLKKFSYYMLAFSNRNTLTY